MKHTIKALENIAVQIKKQIINVMMCDQKFLQNNTALL
ncbi:hypothetical protein FHT21_000199 [Pedobacter sp. SG908]|nr:hypothetical protein [Pedobacter sp. SG908]NMN35171.1 hypothetical protein [Pedobacter sp. SG918]